MSRDAIERAIDDDPDDVGNFAVLADWLQANLPSHPRGELISLMLALESASAVERDRLRAVVQLAFDRGLELLLGDLAKHGKHWDVPPYLWRAGFIHRIEVESLPNPHVIVGDALVHESGQFVRELVLAGTNRNHLRDAITHIAKRPRTLRLLEIGANQELGPIDALWPALSKLRHLVIEAGFEAREIALPGLEYATFAVPFTPATLQAVARARWPKLKHLRIMHTGENPRIEDLGPLFERPREDLPALRHLALENFHGIERPMVERLLRAPWLDQLVNLGLRGNDIGDAEAFLLADKPARFRSDLSIEVEKDRLSRKGIAALRVLDPRV